MKANFPVRLVGAVAGRTKPATPPASRTVVRKSWEGKGDFMLVVRSEVIRFQSAWIGPTDLKVVKLGIRIGGNVAQRWRTQTSQPPPQSHNPSIQPPGSNLVRDIQPYGHSFDHQMREK